MKELQCGPRQRSVASLQHFCISVIMMMGIFTYRAQEFYREMLSWRIGLDGGVGGGAAILVTTRKNQLVWCNP